MSKSTSSKRRHERAAHNPPVICVPAGRKNIYTSRKLALTALNKIRAYNDRNGIDSQPTGVYKCRHCGRWHLTSRA